MLIKDKGIHADIAIGPAGEGGGGGPEPLLPEKFSLGQIVATPGALAVLSHDEIMLALRRHREGNWGLVNDEDREANNQALLDGTRILSAYTSLKGERFWIITEADRSVTTVLLPSEY